VVVVVFDLWCGVGGHFANTKDEGPNFWAADARLGARAGVRNLRRGRTWRFTVTVVRSLGTSYITTAITAITTIICQSILATTPGLREEWYSILQNSPSS
jgi:hypothetical protein